jgi:hypothetical protein
MFQAVAYIGGVVVKTATTWIEVVAANATATPTAGPPVTPTVTRTPVAMLRWEPRTWHFAENPRGLPLLLLYNATMPSGGPAGQVWSYTPQYVPLDCENAFSHGWIVLEAGNGDVWLWVDTLSTLDVADVRFVERGEQCAGC